MSSKPKLAPRKQGTQQKDELTVERYLARDPETDCRIVDAAASLFRQYGFANVRMQDIGFAVGLSKAGLYHHCPSKEELLAKIVRLRDQPALVSTLVVRGLADAELGPGYRPEKRLEREAFVLSSRTTHNGAL